MATREPLELSDLLTAEQCNALYELIERDNDGQFRNVFESKDQPLHPEDTLFGLPLLFIAAGCGKRDNWFSPAILEYLVDEKGADIHRMALNTKAEKYSRAYSFEYVDEERYNDEDQRYYRTGRTILVEDHVFTTVLMNLVLEGRIPACNYLYNHGADLSQVTFDDWNQAIEGETALQLAERKLTELDSSLRFGVEDNIWLGGGPEYLTKERIKVARGLKWLRYITVDQNIPRHAAFWQNRARLRHVLRSAPGIGRLEANYMMKFVPKPAKFQKPSNINLRKINTTLFEGGRATRKRKQQRKQRKTRSAQ
jgi:hypothetical protein